MNLSLSTKKDLLAYAIGFSGMLATGVAAYAIPIPFLRDAINDHLFALIVWTGLTLVGWRLTRWVRTKL